MNNIRYGRKASGIKRELQEKIKEWISTIDNKCVVAAIKRDTIVTGGSIASMLLGEKVNDYDIYFRTKETTIAVAEYYVNRFNEDKKKSDTEKGTSDSVSYVPCVKEDTVMNCKGETENRVLIHMQSAGVAAIDQEPYKYFETVSEDATHSFGESIKPEVETKGKYRPVFLSQNAITLSDKTQIVIRFYGEPDKIHSNYDFVHAMNYYDFGTNNLVLHPAALEALLGRTLVYRGSLYPIASIFRTKKFIERGWRISAGEQLKMCWQISELDLKDHEVVKEQLTGVDQAYLHQLTAALSNVDMKDVDSTYVATIIDRIFNTSDDRPMDNENE